MSMTTNPAPPSDTDHGDHDLTADLERYRAQPMAIEPGGVEHVPLAERHGRPVQLLWTWTTPNLEFATVFVGYIGVAYFGLSFWQALLAIVVGNGLAAVSHYVLSCMGPRFGLPQMVLSRLPFGFLGNAVPAAVGSLIAGLGWFAVNAVSGAFALSAMTGWNAKPCLVLVIVVQIVVAFFGHRLVAAFERFAFPLLAAVWLLAAGWTVHAAHFGAPGAGGPAGTIGGFTLTAAACFGYAAGWNPYAADYTRYLTPDERTVRRAGVFAAIGLFASTTVLEVVGAAWATAAVQNANPTSSFIAPFPSLVANLTLLSIAIAACGANVLNVYSAGLSFLAIGIRIRLRYARAAVAAAFGIVGAAISWSALSDGGAKYENFLLVVAYWLGPWLGVVLADRILFRHGRLGRRDEELVENGSYDSWAGLVALAVGLVVSVLLFSNQTEYHGLLVRHHPGLGDVTFLVGALLSGAVYAALVRTVLPARLRGTAELAAAPSPA